MLSSRFRMLLMMLALLLAAGVFACLFSFFLPSSASLLAPTQTLTPTVTASPTATLTATSISTPLPAKLITPRVIPFPPLTIYWSRTLWEEAVGKNYVIEDFEKDPADYGELRFPYFTGNHFILSGKSAAQFLNAPELLPSGNLLHFRDWEYGLTFTFPNDATTTVLGFDYASQEEWQLTVLNIDIILPSGRNQFVGIVLYAGPIKAFRLTGPDTAQGDLSVDNISYIP
jgi:hypothetical protein